MNMRDFLKIMEKDITEDKFSMFEAIFYLGVIITLGVVIIALVSMLNWLVTF